MIAVALKGLAGRKIRALLTAFAVVIGVSMVSGTFILTDTMQKAFDGLFNATYEKTDAVVAGKEVVEGQGSKVTVPASVLERIRALPEVQAASGTVSPEDSHAADIIDADGKAVAEEGLAWSYDAETPQFSPFKLKAGAWPNGRDEVVVDAGTASKQSYAVGDSITVATPTGKERYRITGTASFGDVDSLGFGSIVIWDVESAQAALGRDGRFDTVSVAAKQGTSPAELVKAIQPLVGDSLAVKDSAKQAEDDSKQLDEGMGYVRLFLLGFAGIALLVGAFVIFNTLSITVAQRTREFATLRTLGASRKQVMRSVVLEGLVIGLVASAIGLALGFGISKGMLALFSALGLDLPDVASVVAPRTIIVSMVLGTVITLIASVMPARRATRVPAIAAVREGATLPASRLAGHSLKLGLGVVSASIAAIAAGVFADGLSGLAVAGLLGGGVLGLFAGIAVLAPRLVKPLAYLVGAPARHAGGVAGELAAANSLRNPGRTASTAAALMIGIALVTVVATLGAGLNASTKGAVADQLTADYVVSGEDGLAFRAAEGDEIAGVRGVHTASHVRQDEALVQGAKATVTGVDPATIGQFYAFEWADGSEQTLSRLGSTGALVTKDYAKSEHLTVGSSLAITTPAGEERTFVVRGTYDPPAANALLNQVSISKQAFDDTFVEPKNAFTFLAADRSAAAGINAAVEEYGDAKVNTEAGYAEEATKDMATMLQMLYVLLGFSVMVSLFGMVNTLVLSVFERTRELGMLRAIGMSRRQARRMIRHESVITALIGAAMGLGLGVFLAALVTAAMSKYDIGFALPVGELVAFTLVAVLAGIAAAVMPARRASRLNVLNALQYE